MKRLAQRGAWVVPVILLLTTCNNLFKPGLGDEVDVEPPTVTIDSHVDGDYVSGSEVFSGTYGDDLGMPVVSVSLVPISGSESPTPQFTTAGSTDPDGGIWSHTIDTTTLADGEYELRVRATDGADRTSDAKAVVRVDNSPSVVLVVSPDYGAANPVNGTIVLTGEAYDLHGVVSVEVAIEGPGSEGSVVAAGTSSWTATIDTRDYIDPDRDYGAGTGVGDLSITVSALDRAGNRTGEVFHAADIIAETGSLPSIQDIYQEITTSGGVSASGVTESLEVAVLSYAVDQNIDDLQFEFSSPARAAAYTDPGASTLGLNQIATGAVEDDDGVQSDPGLVQLRIAQPTTFDGWGPGDGWQEIPTAQLAGSGLRINWQWPLPQASYDQGVWRLQLRAKELPETGENTADIPWSVSAVTEFVIDSGPPSIVVTSPPNGSFYAEDFTIEGSATDGLAVSSVEISYDNATWTPIDGFPGEALTVAWTHDVDVTSIGSGSKTAYLRATDPGGFSAVTSVSFIVDVDGPSIEDVSLAAIPQPVVNGVLSVTGRALDFNGVQDVYSWFGPLDEAPPPLPSYDPDTMTASPGYWSVVPGGANWTFTIDTLDGLTGETDGFAAETINDGDYTLHLSAIDNAGNVSPVTTRTVTVDDDADLPIISLSNVDATAELAADNTFGSTVTILGEVNDDDLVDASSIEARYSDDGGSSWSIWAPVTSNPATDATRVTFSHSLGTPPDGEYLVQFRASDAAGAKDGLAAVQSELGGRAGGVDGAGIPLLVDAGPPVLTLTSPGSGLFTNSDVTLVGTASDGNAVDTVEVRVGGAGQPWNAATDTSGGGDPAWSDWDYTIAVASLGDGNIPVSIRALDPSGKAAEVSYNFNLDRIAPTVSVLSPAANAVLNDTVTVIGTAGDANQVTEVLLWHGDDGAPYPTPIGGAGWASLSGTYSWSYDLDTRLEFDGDHRIYLVARDSAGNVTGTPVNRLVSIDSDSDRPVVTWTNLGPNSGDNVLASSASILATITDDDAVDAASIEWSLDGGSSWSSAGVVATGSGTSISVSIPIGAGGLALSEGPTEHTVSLRAADVDPQGQAAVVSDAVEAPLIVDDNPPALDETAIGTTTEYVSAAAVTLSGTVTDATGIDSFTVRVNGGAPSDVTVGAGGAWDYTTSGADGSYALVFTAADAAGRTSSVSRSILVDGTVPAVTIDPFGSAYSVNELVANGTSSDGAGSGISAVEYSFDQSIWSAATGTTNWFRNIDIGASGANLPEGGHTLYLRATDRAGNTSATASRGFTVDRNDPSLTVNGYVGTVYRGRDFALDGTVNDTLPLGGSPITVSVVGPSGAVALGSVNYDGGATPDPTWSQDVSTTVDGEFTVTITATDAVGRTRVAERTVIVDSAAPTLTVTNIAGDGSTRVDASSYTITGTAGDAVSGVALVEYSLDGGSSWNTASGTTSWNVPLSGLTDAIDAAFAVRATDLAGNVTPVDSRTFDVDLAAPALAVTGGNTAPTLQYLNSDIVLSGTASDGNGVHSVTVDYSLDGDPSVTALTDVTDDGVWNVTLAAVSGGSPIGDGEYALTITATDGVGKTSTVERIVRVDSVDPTVEFTSISPVIDGTTVNGRITLRAIVTDDIGLQSSEWAILPDGATPTGGDYNVVGGSKTSPVLDIDTTAGTDNVIVNGGIPSSVTLADLNTYNVWIRGTDRAGNDYEVAQPLDIDQSSDVPTIAFTTIDDSADIPAESSRNLIESNALVRFVITDDDRVDVSSLEISVGAPDAWLAVNFNGGAAPTDAKSINTSHNLYLPTMLTEGTTYFYLRVSDDGSAKSGLPAVAESVGPIYVMVDRNFPTVTETSLSDPEVFRSALYQLSGDVADTNALASISITESVDGGAAVEVFSDTLSGTTAAWSLPDMPSGGVADGTYDYQVSVTDASGKVTVLDRRVTIDTTAPSDPVVTTPAADAWLNSATFIFSGTAADGSGSGVTEVYVVETDRAGSAPPRGDAAWIAASLGAGDSWSATVPIAASGERTLHVYSVDDAGNESATATHDFGMDLAAPVVTVSGGANTQYENGDFTIAGTIDDLGGVASVDVDVSDDNVTYGAADPATAAFDNGAGTWSWDRTLGAQTDGIWYYRFTFTDLAGNQAQASKVVNLDRSAPGVTFSATTPSIDFDGGAATATANGTMALSGSVSENQGVANLATLEYRIDGGGWSGLVASDNFTIPGIDTSSIDPTGTMVIDLRATDRNGNAVTEPFTFNVDQATDRPVVTIGSPADGATINLTSVSVSGTVTDDDGVPDAASSVQYRFSTDGTTGGYGAWQDVSVTGAETSRSFTYSVNDPTDGAKLLEMRAFDENGVESLPVEISLTIDTDAPEFAGISPADGSWATGDFALTGTVSDSNGDVTSLRYRVERDGIEVTAWTDILGSAAPSIAINETIDTGAGSGTYEVFLEAGDGTFTRTISITVFVDLVAPTVSFTAPADLSTTNNLISVTGTSNDAEFDVAAVEVVILDANAGGIERALPTGTLSGTTGWSISGFDTRHATLLSYAQDLGGDVYEVTLRARATDEAGNVGATSGLTDLTFRIDQSTDRPVVSIDGITTPGDTLTSTTITGTVQDDDGVDSITVDTWNVGNSSPIPDTTETVTLTSGTYGGTDLSWRITLSDIENGLRGVRVRAIDTVDNNGQDYGTGDTSRTDTDRIDFSLDTENPDAAFTAPVANITWSGNSTFEFTGTAGDETGITALAYKIDDNDFSSGTTAIADTDANSWTTWRFTIPPGDLSNGAHTIYVEATDSVGKTRLISRQVGVDKTAPTITVNSPPAGEAVFGPLTIAGTAADNAGGAGVDSVAVGFGKQIDAGDLPGSTWTAVAGTTNWSFSFLNINDYANTAYAYNTGDTNLNDIEDGGESWTNIWDFTFYVRAIDSAADGGNTAYLTTYTLQIDPLRDRPEVTILSPADGATVGGFVRLFGTAFDSQFLDKVQIAIDANNNGDYTDDVWSEGTLDETSGGVNWYQVNGTSSWSINLNEANEFDPTGAATTRTIGLQVRAKDYKTVPGDGIYGAPVEYSITFNKNFPQFDGMNLVSGTTVGGTINLEGIVRDESDIDRILFSNQGPLLDTTVIFDNPGGLMPPGASNQDVSSAAAIAAGISVTLLGTADPDYDAAFPGSYRVVVPIDTEAAGLYPGGAGSMSVKLSAEDTTTPSPFTNQYQVSLNVDNLPPSALTYTGGGEIVGTAAELQGTVQDLGTISGIDRLVVYITNQAGEILRLQGGSGAIAGFDPNLVLDASDSTYADYRMVIDNRLEGGNDGGAAGDGDGIDEFLSIAGGTYNWAGQFDSTLLADGPVTVNYSAEDFAGNRTAGTTSAFVANNAPSIDAVVLGTDLNGDGDALDGGEQTAPFTTGYATTGYTARNNLLYLGINASSGNGTLRYSVLYGGVEQNVTLTDSTLAIDTSGIPDSTGTNDRVFTVLVYDSTVSDDVDSTNELSDTITLGVTIDNVDETPPTVAIAPLGRRYTESQDDTAKMLYDGAYTDFVGTSGGSYLGHVEYPGESIVDGNDADVSGEVVFRGRAGDNQRVARITASLAGYDPDGGGTAVAGDPFEVYNRSIGGAQSDVDWTFALDGAEYLTEQNGNVFNWSLTIDTAVVDAVVGLNATLEITAYDANGTPNSAVDTTTVDIVPYIGSIQRDSAIFETSRSKLGAYPVQQNETGIVVRGFNLPTTTDADNWVRVYNSAGTLSQSVTVAASPVPTSSAITIELNGINASGYLRISTNGVEAINNSNDNGLDYNKEDDGSGIASTLWNDDRYLTIWEVGDFFTGSNDPERPSMDIRTSNGRIYGAWSNYATSSAYYARPDSAGVGRTLLFSTYDPPEWTDILAEQGSDTVHTALVENYYNGGNAWGYLTKRIGTGSRADIERLGDDDAGSPDHSDGRDEQLYQFQNVRMAMADEGSNRVYLAYYDAWAQALKYAIVTGGTETFVGDDHRTDGQTVVDGIDDFDNDPSDSGDNVGQYLDIGIDPDDGMPVIVYYDTTNKTLKIARGQSVQPVGTGEWTIANVLPVNSFSGQYVTMKIDSSGDLHIAYQRVSTGDLLYIHARDVDGTGAGVQYSFDNPVVVDSEGSVGAWADIYLIDDLPVISYLNSSQIGTFSGIKIARYIGDGTTWEDAGDWDYEIVPVGSAVTNKRTNIVGLGAADASGWNIAVGYAASTFDIVYRREEQ